MQNKWKARIEHIKDTLMFFFHICVGALVIVLYVALLVVIGKYLGPVVMYLVLIFHALYMVRKFRRM